MTTNEIIRTAAGLLAPAPIELRQVSRWLALMEPTIGLLHDWLQVQSESPAPDPHALAIAETILTKQAQIEEWDRQAHEEHLRREQAARTEAARVPTYTGQSWRGRWPMSPDDVAPPKRVPVVYWLYEAPRALIYIGSSGDFLARMRGHERDKTWVQWRAKGCHSRRDAYRLEKIEIDKSRPPLNHPPRERRGRDYVHTELRRRAGAR